MYVLCCYINFIMAGQQKWWNTSHYRVPSTIKSNILVKCQGTIIFPHTLYTCNLFLLVFLFSEYFSLLYWLEGIWIIFLPQTQEEKNKTTLTFLNQSVISSECIWSRTVGRYSLCFLGLLGGMNVGVCIDCIDEGKANTFRWFITIIKLCHSSSEVVKYLLQLLIVDTIRTRCHVPTAAIIYLSHVGTHWPPPFCV